jgi:ankyrin repeat protein
MIAAGADVNVRSVSREQTTGLLEAIIHNHTYIIRFLLENGASPDVADLRSRRLLTLVTSGRSDIAITRMLL